MKPRMKAFTLIEVLIVVAIITILVGIIWLAVGPPAKARALDTRISSDLHQLAIGVSLYREEHDGGLPISIDELPASLPRGIGGFENEGPLGPQFRGPRNYDLVYSRLDAYHADLLKCVNRWDEDKHGMVEANFRQKIMPGKIRLPEWDPKTWKISHYRLYDDIHVLQGFLDGHVAWISREQLWIHELATRRAFSGF